MIENVELLYSVCKTLKDRFPKNNIFIDDNKKEIIIPTFSIKIKPLKSTNHFNFRKKLCNIYITFVEDIKTQENSLKMIDDLTELFDEHICVKSRMLPILNKDINYNEDCLNFMMTLNFYDGKAEPVPETPDATYDKLMGILKLNISD
ncbi:hypothetical protein U728_1081 [Clostridium botulinum 202F]|nr:hypothetical protein U728_1081 [Clostridium botulinum 202F]KAI3344364.1 hypothetical protein CIT17_17245 [Clostridium botulinum]KON13542.1 hypothetical protein ACP50_05605 [Clostridium botulinum]MBY6988425.1 hypothetical protein [Clostridium botulinum]NFH02054.1 hypothetical protein [Clostridium botulinum]